MMMERKRKANIKIAKKYFPKKGTIDSVRDGKRDYDQRHDVLQDAFSAWHALDPLREKERRDTNATCLPTNGATRL